MPPTVLVLLSYYYPAVTRPFNGALPLIDPNSPDDVINFLEGVFERFRSTWRERHLAALARAMADVRTRGFLETRALQLASLVELVVSADTNIAGGEFVVEPQLFEKKQKRLTSLVRQALQVVFPDADTPQVNQVVAQVVGMNRVAFARRLAAVATRLGAMITEGEIRAFVNTRNELVHRGTFTTEKQYEEVRLMQSIVDRLVMGLLNYRGPYIDSRTLQRVE